MTSPNGSTIGWTSYNYPSSVATATESVSYFYGPDRQRWKETYQSSSGTETTYRAGRLFEVAYYLDGGAVLAHYRHYVYAGNELVSIDDRSTATTPQYYVISDHQGSYSSIETGTNPGTNFVSESFTPFGNRRSGETWSGPPAATPDEANINIVSRRGFTGESVIGISMGLNHLNGRVEDSITGRFLSADPWGINSGNTQSFNRYSFVNNNLLTYTDPTGFDTNYCQPASGGTGDTSNAPPPIQCTPADPDSGFDGAGGGSPPDYTLPDVGCGIPPYGPCPSYPQIASSPFQNGYSPWTAPIGGGGSSDGTSLSKCLQSIVFCNSTSQHPAQSPGNKLISSMCAEPSENAANQLTDFLANSGTGADSIHTFVGARAAVAGSRSQVLQAASTIGPLMANGLSRLGVVGNFAALTGVAVDLYNGEIGSAVYDSIDAGVYYGLTNLAVDSAIPTAGLGTVAFGGSMVLYNNAGGSRTFIQRLICPSQQ